MSRLRARVAFGVLLALIAAGGQGVTASGASSPAPPPSSASSSSTSPASPASPTSPTSPTSGKAQRIAAEQAVAPSAAKALGLGNVEKLVVKDVITDTDGTTHVRYNRTYDGLRVIGGDFVSHRDKSGNIKGVTWNGSHRVAVSSTTPKLSLASANAAGTRRASWVQESTAATKGELVVYSGGASPKAAPRLAYDVLTTGVRADQTPSRLHTIVDANTGATLASWDEIQNDGTGNGIYVGSVSIGTIAGPPWSMRDSVGNYTTNLEGQGNGTGSDIPGVPGTTFTNADNIWGNGTVTDSASAAVDAHYGAEKTFDYFKNIQGRNGIWGDGVGARSRVHYGNAYENAFWDGTQMTYGDGAGNTHPLVELDVAGHEMTHGVTEQTAGLVYAGEAGGLNEATSDIFGTAVEFYANNPADNPDYLIGEKININGNDTQLRSMDRPSKDGLSLDCWSPSAGGLDPHYSSGPLNHWFYLASEGSGAKVINGVSYDSPTCNSSTVTGIGRDKVAKIWYRTLTTYLTSGSDYAAAREGAIQSAKDLYGPTSTECTGVAASFSAIAVPPGVATCGVTPPPPSCSNLLSNPGFESGDTLWSATPVVIDQWGEYQAAHSGTWSAWLGGYEGSAGVEDPYYDSISQLVTVPAGGSTLSYYVAINTHEAPASPAHDTMTVRAGTTVLQTLSNVNAADGYQYETVDLSAYAGQTTMLSFSGVANAHLATSFFLDDLSVSTSPGAPTAVTATLGNAQAAVSWTAPVSEGGCPISGYTVTASPGGRAATTTGATAATVTGLANGTAYTFTVTATNGSGTSTASLPSATVTPRTVPGAPRGVAAAAGNTQAVVSWTAPASDGGSAITGYMVTASPGGRTATTTGATTAAVTGLTNGTAYTFTVTAANVAGTSSASSASGAVTPRAPAGFTGVTTPVRVLDTRIGLGAPRAKLGAGRTVTLTVPGLPVGTTAVALNVTATGPTAAGYLTVYPGGAARPTASNLNFAAGQTIPNMVLVRLGPGNTVTFFNSAGGVNVIADVLGYYAPGTGGGFTGVTPTRVLDTRIGLGAARAKVGAGRTVTLTVPGLPAGTTAVALNVAVTGPTAASYLTVYPNGQLRPTVGSNLNYVAGQTIPNMVLVPLGPGNTVKFYNAAGTVNVIADVVGSFTPGTGAGFTGTTPTRVLDTRTSVGGHPSKLGAGATLTLTVPGLPTGATAVALNVAVTGPTAASYLTVYPNGQPRPTVGSNLNYVAGQTIPNMVLVPLGPGNTVKFYNAAGTVNIIADVLGYFG